MGAVGTTHVVSATNDRMRITTRDGKELSRRLKAAGFRFVGETTVYAAMQSCGIVNDHEPDCWVREEVERARRAG